MHATRRPEVRRWALTAAVLAVAGLVAWLPQSVEARYTTATNTDAQFTAGTVVLGGNDSGAAMFSTSGMSPGDSVTKCVAVTYTGSLPAQVRLYASGASGLAAYLTMTVTRGSSVPDPPDYSSGDGCGTFTPDAATYAAAGGVLYTGTLAGYATAYPAFASGLVDPTAGTPATWVTGSHHVYRVVLTLSPDPAAQGLSATPTLTWEARNT